MVLVNTKKGMDLLCEVQSKFIMETHSLEEAIKGNDALEHGSVWPKRRNKIYQMLREKGFEAQYKKYYTDTLWRRFRLNISIAKQKMLAVLFKK